MKSAQCANHELSQPRGSTDEKLQVCQSGLSQRRGSPHWTVPILCPPSLLTAINTASSDAHIFNLAF